MKAKEIIRGIVKLTAVSGIAYLAYKIGEFNGEQNERIKRNSDMVDSLDEEDVFGESEPYEPEQPDYHFSPLNTVHVDGVPDENLNSILMTVCLRETVSNKAIRDKFGFDFNTAETLLEAFEQAGYVSERNSHYVRKVYVTLSDYAGLCR